MENIGFWDRVNEALKTGIPLYGILNPPSSEIFEEAKTDVAKVSEGISDLPIKETFIGFFDTIGKSAEAVAKPLMNQVYILLIIAIVGLYFLGKSKTKLGV